MEHPFIVTLARLREASELYRQLEIACQHRAAEQPNTPDVESFSAEDVDDLELVKRQDRNLRSRTRRHEDELHQLEVKLKNRRARRTSNASTALALAEEIAALQERIAELEQAVLELWQQGEDSAGALAAEQAATDAIRQRLAQEHEDRRMRCCRADQAVPDIASELSYLVRQLPRQIAAKLEQISRRYPDPVADLWQGSCSACGQRLPPQKAVDVDREVALAVCQGCGRFIVARSSRRNRSL